MVPETTIGTCVTRLDQGTPNTSFGGLPEGSPFTWIPRNPSVTTPEGGKLSSVESVIVWLGLQVTVTCSSSSGARPEVHRSGVPLPAGDHENRALSWYVTLDTVTVGSEMVLPTSGCPLLSFGGPE